MRLPTPSLGRVGRAPRPPRDLVARVPLDRGERVLAAVRSEDTWLLGTRLALYVVAPDVTGPDDVHRIGWDAVDIAGWNVETQQLEVSEVGEWGQPQPVHRFRLADDQGGPGRLLELLRERVSASVLMQRRVLVAERRGFNVHARRSPVDGSVSWHVAYDASVDPADVREQVGLALAQARSEVE